MPTRDEGLAAPRLSVSREADPSIRAMDGLRRIVRALTTSAREHSRADEVSGAQRFVLRQVRAAPGISERELAERTLSRHNAVSEVIAQLITTGLVTRTVSQTEGREAVLSLTARGQRVTIRARVTVQERLVQGLAHLSLDRRLVLAESLEAWLEASGLGDAPLHMLLDETLVAAKSRPERKPAVRRAIPDEG